MILHQINQSQKTANISERLDMLLSKTITFPPTTKELVLDYLVGGNSISEIADTYKISYQDVRWRLKAAGIVLSKGLYPRPELSPKEIAKEYISGSTYKEISIKHGCSYTTVARLLKKEGVLPRASIRPRVSLPIEKIKEERAAGSTLEDLAKKYGCHKATIRRRLREHNEPEDS